MNWFNKFLASKDIPAGLAGLATGLYPFLFYYSKNFYLSNSWLQFGFLIALFLIIPPIVFLFFKKFNGFSFYNKYKRQFLFFLSAFLFLFFIELIIHAKIPKKLVFVTFIGLIPLSFLLYKFHKHLIVFQLLLSLLGFFDFVPTAYQYTQINDQWKDLPDDVASVVFKKKPNVYFIQPDGYTSLSEIEKGHYNMDTSEIRGLLADNGFKLYNNFRTNYSSTLSTNSAIFSMKHHYFNDRFSYDYGLRAREIILGNNPVLNAFKNNGYQSHLIVHSPYFLINRSEIKYDFCNFSTSEIPLLSTGLSNLKDVAVDFNDSFPLNDTAPHFFFVEFLLPAHIPNTKQKTRGAEREKKSWMTRVEQSNEILKSLINTISENDPDALVVIMADHGGFVGLEYTRQVLTKNLNRDDLYSVYANLCAIKWPNNEIPTFDDNLKTTVNTFRILFSYLSENEKYLDHLENNGSYQLIKKGAPRGVYRVLDSLGKVDFTPVYLFEN